MRQNRVCQCTLPYSAVNNQSTGIAFCREQMDVTPARAERRIPLSCPAFVAWMAFDGKSKFVEFDVKNHTEFEKNICAKVQPHPIPKEKSG